MITDEGRKRKSFLEKYYYQPQKKESTFQDFNFQDQVIVPPIGPSVLVIQDELKNEMKRKEKKSLTDAIKDIAGRVDKLEGKTEEKMSVRKFEQEMIRKSNEILNSEEKISQTDASIIESTVRLIGHTFGMAGFEQYRDEYLAEQKVSEGSNQ